MKSVWIVEYSPEYEVTELVGVGATEAAGRKILRRYVDKQIALGEIWRRETDDHYVHLFRAEEPLKTGEIVSYEKEVEE